jgi:SM-20-related protein
MEEGMGNSDVASIKIINDFVDTKQLSPRLPDNAKWTYGVYPGLQGDMHPSWHMHFCGTQSGRDRVFHDDVLHATPGMEAIHDVWMSIKEDVAPDHGLTRVYASGHTYGQEGVTHRYAKPSDQEKVAIIYLNSEWNDAWAGETVFYDASRECVSIRPRPGRLVLFDGSISRASRAPSRDCPTLCMTLSFHLRRLPK